MRTILALSVGVIAAGCAGGIGSQTWDKNHDGLVAQCEGLDPFFCEVTPGCMPQPTACIAVCVDDGKGGCGSPCGNSFECVPRPVNRCQDLDAQNCGINPGCEVQTVTVCSGSGGVGETTPKTLPADHPTAGCGGGCTSTQVCVNKTQPSCESTPVASCTANPACELQSGPVCEIACLVGEDCPACATPVQTCVTRPPESCDTRSLDECNNIPGCTVETWACTAECKDDGNGGCLPCAAPPSRCVSTSPAPPPVSQPPIR